MAEIVNLRAKRKEAARKAARTQADANAAKFGQTRAERDLSQARAEKAARDLDAHRKDDTPGKDGI
jgi:hypothetical protein